MSKASTVDGGVMKWCKRLTVDTGVTRSASACPASNSFSGVSWMAQLPEWATFRGPVCTVRLVQRPRRKPRAKAVATASSHQTHHTLCGGAQVPVFEPASVSGAVTKSRAQERWSSHLPH